MNKPNYTIKDIAEMAGVSRATVDRVIHGRGPVSKSAHEKIKAILEKIDYRPNMLARSLKKGGLFRIAVLVPDFRNDNYWKKANEGIDEAISEQSLIGISVDKYVFNPVKELSFNLNTKKILEGNFNGIVLAPLFYRESIEFIKQCEDNNLPCVTFNTQLREPGILCHVGQDLHLSGKTAASLMDKITPDEKRILIVHVEEDSAKALHMKEKEEGFREYFQENGMPADKTEAIKIADHLLIEREIMNILESSDQVGGIYVSTSKVHFIAEILEAYSLEMSLVGYDLIDENISYLESGTIDFLIYQNPRYQAKLALSYLVDHLIGKKTIPELRSLPTEIIIRENLMNYIREYS